jgi:hypothetical protein
LALILLGFASAPRFADSPESVPIETVSLSELNQIAKGAKDAKPAPPPAPLAPARPEPPDLRASTEPPPQPSPPPQPQPPPKPELSPSKAEATPPPGVEATSQAKPLVDDASAPPPPPRPKILEAAPERPKEPQPERPKPTHTYDPNVIAKLIGQAKPSTPATPPTQTSATATPQGLPHHDAPRMSMSMASALDAWLTESYLNCWTPPPMMPDGDTYVAQIKVIFNSDGSLSARPVLLNPPSDPAWRAHAESAMRAVRKCDPLKVPAQYAPYFEQWKVETIHFDPRETQG